MEPVPPAGSLFSAGPGTKPKMTAGNGSPATMNSVSSPVAPSMTQESQSRFPSSVVVWTQPEPFGGVMVSA